MNFIVQAVERDEIDLRSEIDFIDDFSPSPVDRIVRAIDASAPIGTRFANLVILPEHVNFHRASMHLAITVLDANVDFIARKFWRNVAHTWDDWELAHGNAEARLPHDQLQLTGDFSPSSQLTNIWISSLEALGREAGRVTAIPSHFEVAQEFSRTLTSILGTIGQQLRYSDSTETAITSGGRFFPSYQIQLCDAFLILPDQSADFLSLLRSEMFDGLARGCSIGGGWGRIISTRSGDLQYSLSAPVFASDPDFEIAEELE